LNKIYKAFLSFGQYRLDSIQKHSSYTQGKLEFLAGKIRGYFIKYSNAVLDALSIFDFALYMSIPLISLCGCPRKQLSYEETQKRNENDVAFWLEIKTEVLSEWRRNQLRCSTAILYTDLLNTWLCF